MQKQPILWRCDRCKVFQVLQPGDDTDPRHKGCGGNWRVSPTIRAEVVDFAAAS